MNKDFILLKYLYVSLLYLTGCYEPLEIEKLCHPLSEACGNQDFDEDDVANQKDEFPFDKACSKNDVKNCGSCGKACEEGMFCNIDKICEMIKIEVCNGKDDDGNKLKVLLDDEKAYANAADQYYKDIDGYVYNPATL